MAKSKLLPRPFCGSKDLLIFNQEIMPDAPESWVVECKECHCFGPWEYSEVGAGEVWNGRIKNAKL
jgi:Lar family restriction alleviation protein